MRVSVVINTKNEEQSLERCLRSAAWADEIVVLDMNSDDQTVEIARRYTDKVFSCPDFGYVEPARNLAISHATGDWLFVLDADEVVPPRLAANIRKIIAESDEYALVAIPRRNYIGDYAIRNSGWGADYQPRLFKQGRVRWTDTIHTWPHIEGEVRYLKPDSGYYIKHYNYEHLSDFVARLNRYTSVEADSFAPDAEWLNWQGILREVIEEFGKRYTPKEDGFYSLALAGSMAYYRFITHCKRLEQIRRAEGDMIFPLPDRLEEIVAEALTILPQDPSGIESSLQHQNALEELRRREEELTQAREVYESQIGGLHDELTNARKVYETQITHLNDDLNRARATYEAQITQLSDDLNNARALYETQIADSETKSAEQAARIEAQEARVNELTDTLNRERAAHRARVEQLNDELTGARSQASGYKVQLAERTKELARYENELAGHETQLAHQENELAALGALLANREAQLDQQTAVLLKLRAQSEKTDEVLEWIYTSRAWRAASSLRHLRDLKNKVRQYVSTLGWYMHLRSQPIFYGLVETPKESANVAGELEIEGWVFSTDAAVVRVEAFIDDIYLGRLSYGSKRDDVLTAYPSLARAECGYGERVKLKTTMVGHRKLTVRAYDALGNAQIYQRSIVVGSPKMALRPAADAASNGNGSRGSVVAAAIAEQAASSNGAEANYFGQLKALVDEYKSRTESEPAILNWNTGLNLAAALPQLAVFSPPSTNGHAGLPYLDQSVDIVVLPAGDSRRLAEAHRVAAAAIVQAHGVDGEQSPQPGGKKVAQARVRLVTEWKDVTKGEAAPPTTSIIIPVHNKVEYTEQCLKQVLDTLPGNFRGEIIVVDDASTDETPAALKRWTQADERIRVLHNEQNKGFIGSCNAGAEAAHGEMLVFLNNDTLPQPGWLPPLLRILRERPDAGAVGGKLIYPDGTLQEAGGVIFADGSGCNFGRNDKASNAPLYNFLREVDYCSGALLATPRALFLSLGGFDTRFTPAYYEDTDYCFTLRESGRKVYYQPESVIIHFEGVSSGTDVKSGIKSFQAVNRVKFIEKWQHVLKRQPSAPARYDFNTLHALSVREEKRDADAD